MERRIIQQSSRAAEKGATKQNHCLYRHTDLSIKPSSHEGAILSSDVESEQEEVDKAKAEQLRDKSHQIKRLVKSAKRNLAAKQLMPEKASTERFCFYIKKKVCYLFSLIFVKIWKEPISIWIIPEICFMWHCSQWSWSH